MTLRDLRETFAPNTRFFLYTYGDEGSESEAFEITNILWGTNSFISMEANYVQCRMRNNVFIYSDMPLEVLRAWQKAR